MTCKHVKDVILFKGEEYMKAANPDYRHTHYVDMAWFKRIVHTGVMDAPHESQWWTDKQGEARRPRTKICLK